MGRPGWARHRWGDQLPGLWAASSIASRSVVCGTRPSCAGIAGPTLEHCQGSSFRHCKRAGRRIQSSCWTKLTSWRTTPTTTLRERCSRSWILSRIRISVTITFRSHSTFPMYFSFVHAMGLPASTVLCLIVWRLLTSPGTRARRRFRLLRTTSFPSSVSCTVWSTTQNASPRLWTSLRLSPQQTVNKRAWMRRNRPKNPRPQRRSWL
mmetsp:Transcript_16778/g.40441  ORF Transcript_16778/g.40441 Transcript_16778/m.40441 type:complete len:208 (-) Transcript_16778:1245-1868(-)